MIKIDNTSTLPISYGYDADGRHASTTQRSHQTTTGYDGAGNITASTDELGNTTHYIYTTGGNDQLDQLTGVTYTDGTTASYSYDQAGNRTSQTAAGTTTHYSYDDASQLVGIDGVTVSHDQAGNVTSIGSTSYDWDWLGRMVKITSPAGTANYSYDGDNLRVQATGDTAATGNLLYDRQTDAAAPQLIADTNGSYTWTPAGQLSQQIGNTTSYTLADALGSTRALTDSSGAVTATVDYDVYGNVRNQTGTWGPYGYTAGIQTGSLVTLGERDLRTDIGQFLSTDPERPGGNGVTGWNQYTYVTNNPTTYVDPTGREMALEYTDVLKIGAVAVVGGYAISKTIEISVDALQRCLANTSCVLHPPAVTRPTSGTGNPAAANPPSIQDISNSLMTWATAALSETAARVAAQACETTLSGSTSEPTPAPKPATYGSSSSAATSWAMQCTLRQPLRAIRSGCSCRGGFRRRDAGGIRVVRSARIDRLEQIAMSIRSRRASREAATQCRQSHCGLLKPPNPIDKELPSAASTGRAMYNRARTITLFPFRSSACQPLVIAGSRLHNGNDTSMAPSTQRGGSSRAGSRRSVAATCAHS